MANSGRVANGSYRDKGGTSWLMYGPSKGGGEDSRLEEGMQMQEWPRGRALE